MEEEFDGVGVDMDMDVDDVGGAAPVDEETLLVVKFEELEERELLLDNPPPPPIHGVVEDADDIRLSFSLPAAFEICGKRFSKRVEQLVLNDAL